MNRNPQIRLEPFRAEDQERARELILAGLVEHWGVLDPSKNPDLKDIAESYANGVFLVARLGERIIGTGALLPRPDATGEIVRMSVAAARRRMGIGRQILEGLREQARARGYQRLVLETTATWQDAIDFYLKFGFQISHYRDGDVYFVLDLRGNKEENTPRA